MTLDSESIDSSDDERSTGDGETGRLNSVGSGMRRDFGGSGVNALGGVGTRSCGVGARSGSVIFNGLGARSGSAEIGDSAGGGAGAGGRGVGRAGLEGFAGIACFSTTCMSTKGPCLSLLQLKRVCRLSLDGHRRQHRVNPRMQKETIRSVSATS